MTPSMLSRRTFLHTSAAAAAGASRLSLGASPVAALTSKQIISIPADKPFRILQITDIHFFTKKHDVADPKSMELIGGLIEKFSPDVIAVTGDLWHNDQGGQGLHFCEACSQRIGSFGVPWFFAWGNHDEVRDRAKGNEIMENAPNSLYSRGDGNGNYRIELQDEKMQKPLWQFVILNTGKIGVSERETAWFAKEATALSDAPGFIFCHIPVMQYASIWNDGTAVGVKHEKVCNEEEKGAALPKLAKPEIVKAMFVGHDHVNDYSGASNGVNLVYGRATGFGGYGGDKVEKGGTLIEIHPTEQTYTYISVFPDGRTWKQKREA